jgi:hypothetical protein
MSATEDRKHLRDMSIQELEKIICEECKEPEKTLDQYLCPNCSKDDDRLCVDCCGCYDD